MWWLLRGAQSAAFYYISCAPCHDHVSKRKRKKEAVRARQEKRALETEQPGLFNQPSPFSTNIYWREELALGPGPPPKRGGKDNQGGSQRRLNTGGAGSSLRSSASASHGGSLSPTETHLTMHSSLSEDGWNRKRYQREDESLWGTDLDSTGGYQGGVGATDGPTGRSRSGTATSGNRYLARNPPVNDYHPPVVSTQPTSKSETKWMLQPPPSAKIMSGKERATRSRSNSGGSSRKGVDVNLGKRVGERLMEEKVKRGEVPPGFELPFPSRVSSKGKQRAVEDFEGTKGQTHDRIPQLPALHRSFVFGSRTSNPSAITIAKDMPYSAEHTENQTAECRELPDKSSAVDSHAQTVPIISTPDQGPDDPSTLENSYSSQQVKDSSSDRSVSPTHSYHPVCKPYKLAMTSPSRNSLHVLQELVAPNSALNPRPNSPLPEAKVSLPPSDSIEQEDLKLPEVESRFPGDFRFPDSTPEKTTAITSRRSMDI
ncbi:MAG: hypothetical protein M1836_003177 [Candelina mexicana]|nr:MAG: hypothetical protein M1836_003177 [Candelina mexicana]